MIEQTEEEEDICLSFCAINESEAIKLSRISFPQSEFVTASTKKPNHFFFRLTINPSDIPHLIESMDKFKIVQIRIPSQK